MPLPCHDRYGPTWAGKDIVENLYDAKDYLGIILPVAISTVGISLTALDSAKTAGTARFMQRAAFSIFRRCRCLPLSHSLSPPVGHSQNRSHLFPAVIYPPHFLNDKFKVMRAP